MNIIHHANKQGEEVSNQYTPKPGDRVKGRDWYNNTYVDVVAVDEHYVFGYGDEGLPDAWKLCRYDWVKVEGFKPLPAAAAYLTSSGYVTSYRQVDAVAIIHVGTGLDGDYATVERIEQ